MQMIRLSKNKQLAVKLCKKIWKVLFFLTMITPRGPLVFKVGYDRA